MGQSCQGLTSDQGVWCGQCWDSRAPYVTGWQKGIGHVVPCQAALIDWATLGAGWMLWGLREKVQQLRALSDGCSGPAGTGLSWAQSHMVEQGPQAWLPTSPATRASRQRVRVACKVAGALSVPSPWQALACLADPKVAGY